MSLDDPEIIAEFVTESREHLADVEGQLLEIEAGGVNINVDLVNTVFRAIHSIKGAAGFLGLTTVNKLAHSLENVLGKMRTRELAPNSAIVDVMLRAADALTKLIHNVEASNAADVSAHVAALDAIYAGELAPLPAAPPPTAGEPMDASTPPAPYETNGHSPELQSVAATEAAPSPAAAASPSAASPAGASPSAAALVASAPAASAAASSAPAAGTNGAVGNAPPAGETSIRVQVGVLDSLMNLAGELVLGRNQLMQTMSVSGHTGIEAVAARLDQVTTELQEAIMRTRMQPIGNVFSKFPRVARDLSAKLGKQCEIQMEGKEVEVDKTILEAIGDPLTHLVRNSIDHGVERPEVRTANGKHPSGTLTLRAYHQAGKVRIDVADDGAGIEPARLKQKAIVKGVITAEQGSRMSDRDTVRLIFHPGFSTAEKITDVSGRGVGMDVVRTNIEKLGGTVDVDSIPNRGTTIQITLPLTLAIIPSLIIRTRGERFAVPQVNVLELVRVRANELNQHLGRVKDAEVLRLRDELLPLIRLDQLLGLRNDREPEATGPINVIVIESGSRHYGLVVDEIVDSEEIVVKPLGRHVKSCCCLAGATILGDGHVALILDAAGIAAQAELSTTMDQDDVAEAKSHADRQAAQDVQDLLLFSTGPEERFAVPMSLVTRIERIHTDTIKTVGGRRLLQYRGFSLPLIRLEDYITTPPMAETDRFFVIVFRAAGREAGLLVPHLDDIRQLALDIDAQTFREKGVAGAFVLGGTTMRLVDVVDIAELAHPEWFTETKSQDRDQAGNAPLVLVAEDSSFFRRQVSEFLNSKGLQVVGCEDGARAWDYLISDADKVQLVITDIEMPNMNGFELCRKIKQHPTLGHMPVIALTSLASEADVERGRDAGVDEYQVKMDREQVWEAVTRMMPRMQGAPAASYAPETYAATPCLTA